MMAAKNPKPNPKLKGSARTPVPKEEIKAEQQAKPSENAATAPTVDNEGAFSGPDKKTCIANAKGQTCAHHPWRAAHAVCAYCNRPFCYQDLIEFKNSYYCSEDMDLLYPDYKGGQEGSERVWAVTAGILLLLATSSFYYFAYNGVLNLIVPLVSGLPKSLLHVNISAVPFLVEVILAAISIILAFLVLWNSRKAFYITVIISLGLVFTLTYSLLVSVSVSMQLILVDVITFLSFASLLHSRIIWINASHGIRSAESQERAAASKWGESDKF